MSCFSGSNGSVNLTASGGTGTLTFAWSNAAATEDLSGLSAGTYDVTVTDANSCTATASATVTAPATALAATAMGTNPLCPGATNGSINLTQSGGTSPYTYAWTGGATTEDRSGIGAGTYSVTVTDANGCTATASATLSAPTRTGRNWYVNDNSLTGDVYTTAVGNNSNIGTANCPLLTIAQAITNASAGDTIYVDAGSYAAAVTVSKSLTLRGANRGINANNPSDRTQANPSRVAESIINPASGTAFTVSSNISNVTIDGFRVTGTGITLGFSLNLGTGMTGINILNNFVQNIGGTGITDNGASYLNNTLVQNNRFDGWTGANGTGIRLYVGTHTNVTVDGNFVRSTGNTTARGIQLSMKVTNGAITNNTIRDIAVWGLYSANGQNGFMFSGNDVANVGGAGVQVQGYDATFGSNNVTVTNNTFTNIGRNAAIWAWGWYDDAYTNWTITNNTINQDVSVLTGNFSMIDLQFSQATAGLNGPTTISGNTMTLTGTFNTPNTANAAHGVRISGPAGTVNVYNNVLAGRGNGLNASLVQTSPAGSALLIRDNFCYTCAYAGYGTYITTFNGTLNAYNNTITGGEGFGVYNSVTSAYSNLGANMAANINNNDFSGATPVFYRLASGGNSVDAECNWYGTSNGNSIAASVIGNVDFVSYLTSGTDTDGATLGFQPATGTCTGSVPTASATATDATCNGGNNGSVALTVTDGTAPYTFSWSNASTDEDLTGLTAGTYTVTVTDANGTTATATATVNEPSALSASGTGTTASCVGGNDGSIDLTVSGGSSPYSFSWDNGSTDEDPTGLSAGTYAVTVTDNNSCSATASVAITANDAVAPTISCPANISVSNDPGVCGASVTFEATASDNCSATVTYSIASGSSFSIGSTTVTATATDPAGNSATCSFTVTVTDDEAPVVTCPAQVVGTVMPGATNGTATFSTTVTDNCSATVSYSHASGSSFPVGSTTVTATATDASGNTSVCTFRVVIPRYLYVDHTATAGANNGSNWTNAFRTLAQAVTASVAGRDTILVAAGTYSPTRTLMEKFRMKSFVL